MRRLLVLLLLAAFVFAGAAVASSPPRRAYLAAGDLLRVQRALHYYDEGCFHVAPREWICPEPYPGSR